MSHQEILEMYRLQNQPRLNDLQRVRLKRLKAKYRSLGPAHRKMTDLDVMKRLAEILAQESQ